MRLLDSINNSNLPIKQQKVIQAILNDLESNSFLSGQEICEKFKVSFSSLTRMSKALGYKGFPQLKKEIEKSFKQEISPTYQASKFLSNTSKASVLESVIDNDVENIIKLKKSLDTKMIETASKELYSAKNIYLIGVGQVSPIAQKFSESLSLLGKNTILFNKVGFSKELELYDLTNIDIVLLFSINRELKESLDCLTTLNKTKTKSILLTDKKTGMLSKQATYCLNSPIKSIGMINNLISIHTLTNILEANVFAIDQRMHLNKIKNIEDHWDSLPIFLN